MLEGRTAIVTGGANGIGRGICLRLAEAGADVVVADIVTPQGQETAEMVRALGRDSIFIETDVSVEASVVSMVKTVTHRFGGIDILVNDAGIVPKGRFTEITEAEWDRTMDINLKGTFLCSREVVKQMLATGTRGKIVNVASIESEVAFRNQAHYAASKGGVAMLTKAMALDLAEYGINVNAVGPGTTDSRGRLALDAETMARLSSRIPLGRVGTPRDTANAVLFLASPEADWITGHILYVDGGYLAT
ncbi:MAG: SDR family NAD(P)-dependent oxidoreductase [Bacillota bacterium]